MKQQIKKRFQEEVLINNKSNLAHKAKKNSKALWLNDWYPMMIITPIKNKDHKIPVEEEFEFSEGMNIKNNKLNKAKGANQLQKKSDKHPKIKKQ